MNNESKQSLISDRSRKEIEYSPMPPNDNFDYSNPAYAKRYMQEGVQKKTGFRQLKNVDKEKI